jgi:hypothetical protein
VLRWVHSEWLAMRRVFYGTFHTSELRYKRRHGLLATSTSNNGLQLFTKVKCYFQDDEGPFLIMGILTTRSFSDHTYLTSVLLLIYFVFESYSFIIIDLVLFTPICYFYGFLSSHEVHFIDGRAIWELAEFLLGGNSLVPHDLLKKSWLWKQMRDNSAHSLRHGS